MAEAAVHRGEPSEDPARTAQRLPLRNLTVMFRDWPRANPAYLDHVQPLFEL